MSKPNINPVENKLKDSFLQPLQGLALLEEIDKQELLYPKKIFPFYVIAISVLAFLIFAIISAY